MVGGKRGPGETPELRNPGVGTSGPQAPRPQGLPLCVGGPTGSHGAALPAPARPPASCSRRGQVTLLPRAGRAGLVGLQGACPLEGESMGFGVTQGSPSPPCGPQFPPLVPWVRVTWRPCLQSSLLAWASPVVRVAQAQGTGGRAHTGVGLSQVTPLPWAPDDDGDGDGGSQDLMASALCPTLCWAHPLRFNEVTPTRPQRAPPLSEEETEAGRFLPKD